MKVCGLGSVRLINISVCVSFCYLNLCFFLKESVLPFTAFILLWQFSSSLLLGFISSWIFHVRFLQSVFPLHVFHNVTASSTLSPRWPFTLNPSLFILIPDTQYDAFFLQSLCFKTAVSYVNLRAEVRVN